MRRNDKWETIKAKYKLGLQKQHGVGEKLELNCYLEDDVVDDVKGFYILT